MDRAIKEERNLDYFCFFCRNLWSSSTVHCMTCGKCVEGFDHHCPFINNCIGYKNHGSFLTFLFTTLFYILVQIALLICTLVRRHRICWYAAQNGDHYERLKFCNGDHAPKWIIIILCPVFIFLACVQLLPVVW